MPCCLRRSRARRTSSLTVIRVPALLAHVEDHPVAQDAGAGDEDVDAAEARERGADDAPSTFPVGDGVRVGDRLTPVPFDLPDDVEGRAGGRRAAVDGDAVVV